MTLEIQDQELAALRKISFNDGIETATLENKLLLVSRDVILKKQGNKEISPKEVEGQLTFLLVTYPTYQQLAQQYSLPEERTNHTKHLYDEAVKILQVNQKKKS